MPRPAEIARQVAERAQGFGQDGSDGEPTDGLHAPTFAGATPIPADARAPPRAAGLLRRAGRAPG
ncbi:hypothetical protein STSU_009865 [Streptomyces tsukubensis NRRL18488]|uniref:Uncharacterized protein n=1 Tax=Streptomyces tsukubensis (strain DSM 42081 / NBRC 108919 / NRRL 18488 / 9993) TaxID=1114943 RepID=A0A7G3UBS5_STRT9|nr:hypothetical protein STSU_009865 [Streptomyces tsukubensis NRRL18488]